MCHGFNDGGIGKNLLVIMKRGNERVYENECITDHYILYFKYKFIYSEYKLLVKYVVKFKGKMLW